MQALKILVASSLLLCHSSLFAQDYYQDPYTQQSNDSLKKLVQYLGNLGFRLGYDITQDQDNAKLSDKLLNPAGMQVAQNFLFNTVLGAVPVNAITQAMAQFVPSSSRNYQPINAFANYTFSTQSYNNDGSEQGKVSVNRLLDQQDYQADPVSQAVLNIIGTPDSSFCALDTEDNRLDPKCELLTQYKVMENVLGSIPEPKKAFVFEYNQKVLPQLNANALIAPILYSIDEPAASNSPGASPEANSNQQKDAGLLAQNQAQMAQNFIRYVSGGVMPLSLPKSKQYGQLYSQAFKLDKNTTDAEQQQAQAALASYFMNLRSYAAQSSVGISNLYYILSKRLPQNQSTKETNLSSQAMSEFVMATRRIYNPEIDDPSKQWINQISSASPATVQKEIAILLAEINYQMYLSRQQEERLLMTNSIMLLQNSRMNQPSATLGEDTESTASQAAEGQ